MFNIDFDKLISNLIPWFLHQQAMTAWVKALISPVKRIHQHFLAYRTETLFSLLHNGQVISLEDLLNRVFNPDNLHPRIYIDDGVRELPVYLYNLAEGKNTRLHNVGESFPSVFLRSQTEPAGTDFTVWVHNTINFNFDHMHSLVAKHKAAGFQFQIKTF